MFLRSILKELQFNQIWFNWLNSITKIENMPYWTNAEKLLLIIEILKYGNSLWMDLFKESKREFEEMEIQVIFAWCKSYYWNITIVSWKLRSLAEWLAFYILDNKKWEFDFSLIKWIVDEKTANEFLWDKYIETEMNEHYEFIWKTWKEYLWNGLIDINKYKTDDLLDIISWTSFIENERISKCIPHLLNPENRTLFNTNFKNLRVSIISVISEYFGKESKIVDFILANLCTNDTPSNITKAPF